MTSAVYENHVHRVFINNKIREEDAKINLELWDEFKQDFYNKYNVFGSIDYFPGEKSKDEDYFYDY